MPQVAKDQYMSSDVSAIFITALALAAGLGIAFICARYLKVNAGVLLVSALFAPAVLFLGLSGRLVEFKGLGLEAKFQEAAARPIIPTSVNPSSPSASAIEQLSGAKAYFGIGSQVVILEAPTADVPISRQRVLDVAVQIYPGLLQGNFELLVVLDSSKKVLGYFRREFFFDLFRIELEQTIRGARQKFDSERVGEQLEQTQLWDIVEYPRMRAESWGSKLFIPLNDSNARALVKLTSANQEAAVVVGAEGTYAGIVRRSDIVSELLTALTGTVVSDNQK
jgi:hypothetical protein